MSDIDFLSSNSTSDSGAADKKDDKKKGAKEDMQDSEDENYLL